jgi:flagellin
MALTIGTNVASLQASAAASSVNRDLETSMARLSTGKRINSAADDAAGVAIASRLSSEIRGTDQAIRNALDGKALIDTAEGGHKEIEAILQRMREVSVQSANDTNSQQDRGNLQAEMDALSTEIDRIAGVTTWAGNSVMDGGGGASTTASPASKTFSLQVGAATGTKNQISVAVNAMDSTTLSVGVTVASGTALETDANATTETHATFTAATASSGNSVTDPEHSTKATIVVAAHADAKAFVFGGLGSIGSTLTTAAGAAADMVAKINDASDYQAVGISAEIKAGTTATIELTQNMTKSHVMSADAAKQSITNIDAAILAVNTQRSELGAISNRLTHTVSNMTNISTNLSAARGGIEDADFALETTNLAKNQILQQASTAMLAQANASKQNVLSLLRG